MDASELRAALGKKISRRFGRNVTADASEESTEPNTTRSARENTEPSSIPPAYGEEHQSRKESHHDLISAWRQEGATSARVAAPVTARRPVDPTPGLTASRKGVKSATAASSLPLRRRVHRTIKTDDASLALSYIKLQEEARRWIAQVLNEQMISASDARGAGGGLYVLLRSGCVLCKLANRLSPGAIRSYNKPGSYSAAVAPLSERENITSFVRCCRDLFQLSERDVFSVDDLQNRQGLPLVFRTLQLISLALDSAPMWPAISEVEVDALTNGEDGDERMAVALSEAESMDDRLAQAVIETVNEHDRDENADRNTMCGTDEPERAAGARAASFATPISTSVGAKATALHDAAGDEYASIRRSLSQTLSRARVRKPPNSLRREASSRGDESTSGALGEDELNTSTADALGDDHHALEHHSSFDSFNSEISVDSFGEPRTRCSDPDVHDDLDMSPQHSPLDDNVPTTSGDSGDRAAPPPSRSRHTSVRREVRRFNAPGYEETPERRTTDVFERASTTNPLSHGMATKATISKPPKTADPVTTSQPVEEWLSKLQLQQYWPALEADGWDDLATVSSLSSQARAPL